MSNLEKAFELFDAYNKKDPNSITREGITYPAEYFYALQLHRWVIALAPQADEPLLLASRAQHIGRWKIVRSAYPEGRLGYFRWRTDLAKFHAATATALLQQANYDSTLIEKVQQIILKDGIKKNEEVQIMENALCLVFLQCQFADFAEQHEEQKVIKVLQKTWAKMSEPGQQAALKLNFTGKGKTIVQKALL